MKSFLVLTFVVLGVLAVTVWPTRYRYDRINGCMLRVDRLSGRSDVLAVGYGWVSFADMDPDTMTPKRVIEQRKR